MNFEINIADIHRIAEILDRKSWTFRIVRLKKAYKLMMCEASGCKHLGYMFDFHPFQPVFVDAPIQSGCDIVYDHGLCVFFREG
jgi:hypothetical protein